MEYSQIKNVFNKSRASGLPPHQTQDCTINILHTSQVLHLSPIRHKTQSNKGIQKALKQGYIVPSTSPASASFFFVKKKRGGLCPCIDYCGLNKISVKYPYPLPLCSCCPETVNLLHAPEDALIDLPEVVWWRGLLSCPHLLWLTHLHSICQPQPPDNSIVTEVMENTHTFQN